VLLLVLMVAGCAPENRNGDVGCLQDTTDFTAVGASPRCSSFIRSMAKDDAAGIIFQSTTPH